MDVSNTVSGLVGLSLLLWLYLLLGRQGFSRARPRLELERRHVVANGAGAERGKHRRDHAAIAARQDYGGALTIVLVDDRSQDGTRPIAERLTVETARPVETIAAAARSCRVGQALDAGERPSSRRGAGAGCTRRHVGRRQQRTHRTSSPGSSPCTACGKTPERPFARSHNSPSLTRPYLAGCAMQTRFMPRFALNDCEPFRCGRSDRPADKKSEEEVCHVVERLLPEATPGAATSRLEQWRALSGGNACPGTGQL
jgi:hypothetical protein